MKRSRWGLMAGAAALAALVLGAYQVRASDPVLIAVTAIVDHPALNAVRDGVRDELEAEGYQGDGLNFVYESAQGNPSTAAQIARKFVGENPAVIVPISTPSAQAVVAATQDIPVVFTAVTDPLDAKLVSNMQKPGGNVTGMSDLAPVGKQLALIREILPNAKTIGMPYNPGEANGVALMNLAKKEGAALGFTVIEAPAVKSSDVMTAAQSLIGKVDAIYVSTDNQIVSAFASVVKVGVDNQIPVFAGDTDSVSRGAIAAIGFDYYDVGRQTGKIVVRVLKGEKPGDIAVQGVDTVQLFVNPGAAKAMGVTIPDAVMQRAKQVVQ
ncbi:ABC transporter substrate-binding protein [Hypericibacter terrae]|uniref:ABC transporter substrate-binding protein n=1 Tax=Hypericibacter terrae TaxID=2602015 RepID=A0A5J6MM79_9PROT|nr:ABC transporter substrate-binding protein [Hypericibacter terrae]QEX18321.1 ABC transporter substrate-binding protein [Hypericibacter terrae]